MKLIPKATNYKEFDGNFCVDSSTKIISTDFSAEKDLMKSIIAFCNLSGNTLNNEIKFRCDKSLEEESYTMKCDGENLIVTSSDSAGAFYAIQSLRLLLETDIVSNAVHLEMPKVEIFDCPRYHWRSIMIDESRHFFGKDYIKKTLEIMALHKLNTLHWHLTDDQGWRIEIKAYPLLTEIGSKRKDSNIHGWNSTDLEGKPRSGFYTQEDIKEIVEYAAKCHIQIIPEIDMPAHFDAAFAAYPYLACREVKIDVPWFFGNKIPRTEHLDGYNRSACMGKETTYEFIYKVIDEVTELFPAPYFHIGGDEAPKAEWKKCPKCQAVIKENNLKDEEGLQGYFNNKISEYLKSKGKRLIGWNEVLKAGNLDNSVIAQYWTYQKDKNVNNALKNGGNVIVSKHQKLYFDMSYNQYPLLDTYMFDPTASLIPKEYSSQIFGVEGTMWTEWIGTEEKFELHLYPRMEALCEVAWDKTLIKNKKDFMNRVDDFHKILDKFDINYAVDLVANPKGLIKRGKERKIWYKSDQDRELELNRKMK